jgi:hypothetical protein
MQTPDDLRRVVDDRDRDVPTGVDSLNADSDVSRDARCLGDRYGYAYGLPRGNLDGHGNVKPSDRGSRSADSICRTGFYPRWCNGNTRSFRESVLEDRVLPWEQQTGNAWCYRAASSGTYTPCEERL